MTKQVVTLSHEPMTDDQINKAVDHYRAMLRKHRSEIGSSAAVQQVLGQPEYLAEQMAAIRKRVDVLSSVIIRRVKVDRTLTPLAALEATGRNLYTDRSVVDSMPRGEGKEVEFGFFKPRPEAYRNGWLSEEALEGEYEFFGFTPDPIAQAAVNAEDPSFADEYPNGTHWRDANGKRCFAAFDRWGDERRVLVNRHDDVWNDHWWFGGVRK